MPRKCLLVIPTFAGVEARPFRSFMDIAVVAGRTCPDWRFGTWAPERQSLPMAMNGVAEIALTQGYDALIVFDDDCFPPYDCVPRLLAHYDAGHPFIAGAGVMRNFPHTTTIAEVFPEGPTLHAHETGAKITGHRWLDDLDRLQPLAEVDFCGVPVALMARSIFETVPAPWFGLYGDDGVTITHDVFFCRKLKAAGIPVLVDTTMKCGHLGEAPIVTFENRNRVRELV